MTPFVDDRDPSVIYFGSSWGQFTDHHAFNSTLTWLAHEAVTAKIFFVGSSIGVYGPYYAKSPNRLPAPECLYTIDEGTPVRLTSTQPATTKWGQLFFQSPILPNTSHVLTIEYDDDYKTKDSLVLDFFMIDDSTLPSDPSLSLTTSFLGSTTTTPSTTPNTLVLSPSLSYSTESSLSYSTESSSSFSTPEFSSLSPTSGATPGLATDLVYGKKMPKLPIGPIIGGALGALTFLCTVLLILYLRRRRQDGHSDKNIGAPPRAIGKNSQFLPYLKWLIIPDSLDAGGPQIIPYDILQPPQDDSGGKPFMGTRTEMTEMAATQVATSTLATGTVQRTAQQPLAAPIPGDQPPSYRESHRPK